MTGLEIALIIIGIAFIAGSFFLSEKLSASDMEEIQKLSEKEIHIILEKQLKKAEDEIERALEEKLEEAVLDLEKRSDRETNEKIMAMGEYSDTVLDSMNKSHNEVMFMYSMLNEKQEKLTQMTKEMQQMESRLAAMRDEISDSHAKIKKDEPAVLHQTLTKESPRERRSTIPTMTQVFKEHLQEEQQEDKTQTMPKRQNAQVGEGMLENDGRKNHNAEIINMHQQGKTEVEIAKALGKGLGEVKLVLGLFEGEE